ncbi:MAG: hypothetical protein A2831_01920 [Candidatus Yanofskybacteria bacterium RIFCSPHIGHO2_01_FULL_44_17]|uniref:Uncharacterized protein n=1 Tax=Candidatus Yanofskybacteria bacterium RIFCSPHIGHO2_01_FULL_44_17 TaxID=1802668 RepID=A0A1F8EW99_9BACT|nr:MAG: hypothetical protein A2831_01920 [Candidatus Yanofskybacteria bacterium RIFCSPHIGHO2_01_FULL_44_17]
MPTAAELRQEASHRREEVALLIIGDEPTAKRMFDGCDQLEAQADELERNPPTPLPHVVAFATPPPLPVLAPPTLAPQSHPARGPSWARQNIWSLVGVFGLLAFVLGTLAVVFL